MVQPYRVQAEAADGWRDGVVVDAYTLPPGDRIAVVAFGDGSMTALPETHLRCIEPTYLGLPGEGEPGHEHEFGGKGQPILEGNRMAGMRFTCQVDGCAATWTAPAAVGR